MAAEIAQKTVTFEDSKTGADARARRKSCNRARNSTYARGALPCSTTVLCAHNLPGVNQGGDDDVWFPYPSKTVLKPTAHRLKSVNTKHAKIKLSHSHMSAQLHEGKGVYLKAASG
eukprot:1543313-Pyramimonas_sp.AAC.1